MLTRREWIAQISAACAAIVASPVSAELPRLTPGVGNFRYVYSNPVLRAEFLDFLTNVFHLYPEQDFHQVLSDISLEHGTDKETYVELQSRLGDLSPFLGALRYAIPALRKQKAIMADQTMMLIDPEARYDGHLEIGSTGRYIGILEDRMEITGDVFLLHTEEAGYSPEDMVERGQIPKIGTHIDMGNYSTQFTNVITPGSLDLVTVYIGFHHCPLPKRREFISAVRSVLKVGGKLILRDHDARNEDLWRIAALAHDTFNAGIEESWQFNSAELRNFYSLEFIIDYIEDIGFAHGGQILFQRGDPTRNGLTAFTKI